jgi:hypothetical protein
MRGARDEEFDFSAVVGLNPCRAVSRPPPASAFGSGGGTYLSSSAHIPDWINSTAACVFGQSAGERWALRGRHFR